MADIENMLGKLVVCHTTDGATCFIGEAIGYHHAPTFLVGEHGKGWAASLVRLATLEEQIEYWKAKAEGRGP